MSYPMAMVLARAPLLTLSGKVRLCSQMSWPVVASRACMTAPGACKYMTPSCASGIPSCEPGPSVIDQASLSWPTLDLLICCSGEKRCES